MGLALPNIEKHFGDHQWGSPTIRSFFCLRAFTSRFCRPCWIIYWSLLLHWSQKTAPKPFWQKALFYNSAQLCSPQWLKQFNALCSNVFHCGENLCDAEGAGIVGSWREKRKMSRWVWIPTATYSFWVSAEGFSTLLEEPCKVLIRYKQVLSEPEKRLKHLYVYFIGTQK